MMGVLRNGKWRGRPAVVAGIAAILAARWSVAAPAAPSPTHVDTALSPASASDHVSARVSVTEQMAPASPNTNARAGEQPASPQSTAPAPVTPIDAAPAAPRNPKLFVSDVGSLAHLVARDPVVSPMAQHLVSRRRNAVVTGTIGAAIGGGLILGGVLDARRDCLNGEFGCTSQPNFMLILAGLVILPFAAAVAVALLPTHGDLQDVVDSWNPRHLDNQLAVARTRVVSDSAPAFPNPPEHTGPVSVVPMTGGPPVMGIPVGGDLYIPVTGGPPIPAIPTSP